MEGIQRMSFGDRVVRLTLNWFQQVPRSLQPSIGTMVRLGGKSHSSAIATTSLRLYIVGTRCMPGQPKQNLITLAFHVGHS